jgi:hypothetical protein
MNTPITETHFKTAIQNTSWEAVFNTFFGKLNSNAMHVCINKHVVSFQNCLGGQHNAMSKHVAVEG